MMKRIGALENMTYEINDSGQFFIEENYIGQAATEDHKGQLMPHLHGQYTVERKSFLPISKKPSSFDGRYFGIIPIANIHYKVIPFIVDFRQL